MVQDASEFPADKAESDVPAVPPPPSATSASYVPPEDTPLASSYPISRILTAGDVAALLDHSKQPITRTPHLPESTVHVWGEEACCWKRTFYRHAEHDHAFAVALGGINELLGSLHYGARFFHSSTWPALFKLLPVLWEGLARVFAIPCDRMLPLAQALPAGRPSDQMPCVQYLAAVPADKIDRIIILVNLITWCNQSLQATPRLSVRKLMAQDRDELLRLIASLLDAHRQHKDYFMAAAPDELPHEQVYCTERYQRIMEWETEPDKAICLMHLNHLLTAIRRMRIVGDRFKCINADDCHYCRGDEYDWHPQTPLTWSGLLDKLPKTLQAIAWKAFGVTKGVHWTTLLSFCQQHLIHCWAGFMELAALQEADIPACSDPRTWRLFLTLLWRAYREGYNIQYFIDRELLENNAMALEDKPPAPAAPDPDRLLPLGSPAETGYSTLREDCVGMLNILLTWNGHRRVAFRRWSAFVKRLPALLMRVSKQTFGHPGYSLEEFITWAFAHLDSPVTKLCGGLWVGAVPIVHAVLSHLCLLAQDGTTFRPPYRSNSPNKYQQLLRMNILVKRLGNRLYGQQALDAFSFYDQHLAQQKQEYEEALIKQLTLFCNVRRVMKGECCVTMCVSSREESREEAGSERLLFKPRIQSPSMSFARWAAIALVASLLAFSLGVRS